MQNSATLTQIAATAPGGLEGLRSQINRALSGYYKDGGDALPVPSPLPPHYDLSAKTSSMAAARELVIPPR